MKPPLETTTVREMLAGGGECLLCDLEEKAEAQLILYFLGNSVMQPQIRVKVNRSGFCAPHFQALYKAGNRLGLALIAHTHLQEIWKRIQAETKGLRKKRGKSSGLIRLLNSHREACLICRRLEQTVRGYAFAVTYLWNKDPQFRENLLVSGGFCLPHLAVVHELAEETLSKSDLSGWYEDISALQQRTLEDLEAELNSFTKRYDYRSEEPQPESEKTVLLRAIRKLSGRR